MRNIVSRVPILAPFLFVAACQEPVADASVTGSIPQTKPGPNWVFQRGLASWYGPGFQGRPTASGERFNSFGMTAAHRSLPFGTKLRVVNEKNGLSVVVRVNDRGPFAHRRIIDLAAGAAEQLGLKKTGTAYVALHRVD